MAGTSENYAWREYSSRNRPQRPRWRPADIARAYVRRSGRHDAGVVLKGKSKSIAIVSNPVAGDMAALVVPDGLKSAAGTPKDAVEEDFYNFAYPEGDPLIHTSWGLAYYPVGELTSESHRQVELAWHERWVALQDRVVQYKRLPPTGSPPSGDLTERLKAEARRIGISTIGITHFHRKYVYADYRYKVRYRHIIIIGQEEDRETVNRAVATVNYPLYERQRSYELTHLGIRLADFIRSNGYPVQMLSGAMGEGDLVKTIPYAEEAGLGQLGANGQLLSPYFGSRWRPFAMSTDAPLRYDTAEDFGIKILCDKCQVCVRRCPGRAIPKVKVHWRGVVKNKINPERCIPMLHRYAECNICTMVCPVQKYGLKPVLEHYEATGRILGKGSDALEGYSLSDKGYFPAGKLPKFTRDEARIRYELVKTIPDPEDAAPTR